MYSLFVLILGIMIMFVAVCIIGWLYEKFFDYIGLAVLETMSEEELLNVLEGMDKEGLIKRV